MRYNILKAVLSFGTAAGIIISGMGDLRISAFSADEFVPRLTAPKDDPKEPEYLYFFSDENQLVKINYGMPNCTAYAWGRIYELLGTKPKLSTDNAGRWYTYNSTKKIYSYGCVPKPGAVACWDKNDLVNGHVAVVEKVSDDKSQITVSESQWGGEMFITYTFQSDSSDHMSKYRFLGYIYPDETECRNYGDAYRIKSAESDRLLTNKGKSVVSTDIPKKQTAFQNFRFEMTDKGSYKIYSLTDNRALTRTPDGVVLSDDTGASTEWLFYRESETEYTITDRDDPDSVLSENSNTGKIDMAPYTTESCQLWKLNRLTGVSGISSFIRETEPVFSIDTENTKKTYLTTDFPDLTGIRFFVNSNEITDPDISKLRVYYDFNKTGKTSVKITYNGMSAEYFVTISEAPALTSQMTAAESEAPVTTQAAVTNVSETTLYTAPEESLYNEIVSSGGKNVSEETKARLKEAIIQYLIEYQGGSVDAEYDINKDSYVSVSDIIALFT